MSHRICLVATLVLCGVVAPGARAQADPRPSVQHFICHRGFTAEQCRVRMVVLKRALDRYHADDLGEWSWVLVRTVDWETNPRHSRFRFGLSCIHIPTR